jgi:pectinesterase
VAEQEGSATPPQAVDRQRRIVVAAVSLGLCAPLGCMRSTRTSGYDAVVTLAANSRETAPVYASIQAAVDAAPAHATQPWRIRITRGLWREKVVVDKPFVHFIGDDRAESILSHDTAAGQLRSDGQPWGTWGCASLVVRAPDFAARRMRIENAFDYIGEIARPTLQPIGPNGAQAVALMLDSGADRTLIEDVDILGHQDTLFVDAGRSLFRDCRIAGSVDFVFGGGQCMLDRCRIVSRHRPGKDRQGFVCAPSTQSVQRFGLVFKSCRLHKESPIPPRSVALGRAWRPTRTFTDGRYGDPAVRGSAAFIDCWMDDHIDSAGWDPMGYTARDGQRVMFAPADARFSEYASRGPGATSSATRPQLNATDAQMYTPAGVLAGWDFAER